MLPEPAQGWHSGQIRVLAPFTGEAVGSNSFDAFNYTHTYSLAGLPVAVVPAGEEEGMPIGVQMVAGPYRERLALELARELELQLGGAWRAEPSSS